MCLGLAMAAPTIPSDLTNFLNNHGFTKIIEHEITLEVVPDLMDQDLKDLGMITIGRRRRFQAAGRYLGLVLPTVEERVV